MSIKSAPYYWVVCDGEGCGVSAQEDSDWSAFGEPSQAIDDAVCSEWAEVDGKHYCTSCRTPFDCDECHELKTECVCEATE